MNWKNINEEQPLNNQVCLVVNDGQIYLSKYKDAPLGHWGYPWCDDKTGYYCMFIDNKITHWMKIPDFPNE